MEKNTTPLEEYQGFSTANSYTSEEPPEGRNTVPVEDIADFGRYLSRQDLAFSTKRQHRHALRRFYTYTIDEMERKSRVSEDEDIEVLKKQLDAFVTSNTSYTGMRKYFKFCREERWDNEEKAEKLREFIKQIDTSGRELDYEFFENEEE
jgi:site-specific recombinase XerD